MSLFLHQHFCQQLMQSPLETLGRGKWKNISVFLTCGSKVIFGIFDIGCSSAVLFMFLLWWSKQGDIKVFHHSSIQENSGRQACKMIYGNYYSTLVRLVHWATMNVFALLNQMTCEQVCILTIMYAKDNIVLQMFCYYVTSEMDWIQCPFSSMYIHRPKPLQSFI